MLLHFPLLVSCSLEDNPSTQQRMNSSPGEKTRTLKASDITFSYDGSNAPEWYGQASQRNGRYRASGYARSSRRNLALDKAATRAKRNLAILKGMAVQQPDGTVTIDGTLRGLKTVHRELKNDNGTYHGFVLLEVR